MKTDNEHTKQQTIAKSSGFYLRDLFALFITAFVFIVLTLPIMPSHAAHKSALPESQGGKDGSFDDEDHKEKIINYYDHPDSDDNDTLAPFQWEPPLLWMTEQFSAVMMYQVHIIAGLLDAKTQLETQTLQQGIQARVHKDYRPDTSVCMVGTSIRSLPVAEEVAKVNARRFSEIMLDRDTMSLNGIGTVGIVGDFVSGDKKYRFEQFKRLYCDPKDNNGQLETLCGTPADPLRVNNDINFARTLDKHLTLDIDFTDNVLTNTEEDLIALTRNLFSHNLYKVMPETDIIQEYAKDEWMDIRSTMALRSIARNSFGHLVGMRAPADTNGDPFVRLLVKQLGFAEDSPGTDMDGDGDVDEDDENYYLDHFIGKNPSYFAQMEVLTKKIFQNPDFYTNLYTTPANVDRIGVSLQALKLMQDRDRFESYLRREMLVSILLETKLREAQETVEAEIQNLAEQYAISTD